MTLNTTITRDHRQSKFAQVLDSFFRTFTDRVILGKAIISLTESKRAWRRLRQILPLALEEAYRSNNVIEGTGHSLQRLSEYSDTFIKNLFSSLMNFKKVFQGSSMDTIRIPNTLYHGTTTLFLSSIMKEGLLLGKAGQCWTEDYKDEPLKICLTDSLYAAEFFAHVAAKKIGGEPVVLSIDIKGMNTLKIKIEVFTSNGGGSRVFDIYREFFFTEPIPPDRVKGWYRLPEPSAFMLLICLADRFKQEEA